MKKYVVFYLIFALCLSSCKKNNTAKDDSQEAQPVAEANLSAGKTFGDDFKNETTLSAAEMGELYSNLKPGDTINVAFRGPVSAVCQKKGCWMRIDVGLQEKVMVKFKDYGFFVPTDIDGEEVVINGKAFIQQTPVEELKHYAQDAGESEEAIAAITDPKNTLAFTADGVKLSHN